MQIKLKSWEKLVIANISETKFFTILLGAKQYGCLYAVSHSKKNLNQKIYVPYPGYTALLLSHLHSIEILCF